MKRVPGLIMLLFFTISSWSTLSAQNSGGLTFGGGITYGFELEEVGIQATGTYAIHDNIRIGTDFIYWISDDDNAFGASISSTLFEINVNLHYLFYNNNNLIIYAIGSIGMHQANVSFDVPEVGSDSVSDTELGLAFGGGAEYDLGPIIFYLEPRFFISGFDQLAISAG